MSKPVSGVRLTSALSGEVLVEQGRLVRPLLLAVLALALACLDDRPGLLGPRTPEATRPGANASAIVSNPEPGTAAIRARATFSANRASGTNVVYVSLQPGTIPKGGLATIRNTRTGSSVPTAMADGGFDPVPIEAQAGDTVAVVVQLAGGGSQSLMLMVPATRPPVVVRTDPPARKRDVPLNAYLEVVFSEPIAPSTATSIQLLLAGAPVSGQVTVRADGLRAQFQPDNLLAPNTDYVLSIPTDVADLSGDHLSQPIESQFTTGTDVAKASVATEQAALVRNPFSGNLRTFNMSAVLWEHSSTSGTFGIFYPETGARAFGRVRCFTIRGGDSAWVAGVIDGSGDTSSVGQEYGWLVVDHGPPEGGIPDELSLAWPLAAEGLGTAGEFCANTPVTSPVEGKITLFGLISGNIVVNGSGAAPPPPPGGLSEIAYAAWPNGGIQVVNADGSGGRVLTTASDWNPVWSPDGTKLAFDRRSDSGEAGDIWVMSAEGSGLKQLTSGSSNDIEPTWSPDGARIAFQREGAIWVMSATDGSGLRALTPVGCDYYPTWSPDGSRIAFASCRSGRRAVWVMNADGSGIRQVTNDPLEDYFPRWSPDGTRIAFEHGDCCGTPSVFVIAPDGTGRTQVAVLGRTPSWSPDSRAIVFEWFGMHVVSADGTGVIPLGPGFDPAWSPRGSVPPRPPSAGSIAITPTSTVTIAVGDSVRFVATVKDAAGNVMPGWMVAWTSSIRTDSTSTVATDPPRYSQDWLVTATGPGAVKVIATIDGKSDTVQVIVPSPTAASVAISPDTASVRRGFYAVSLTATVRDARGQVMARSSWPSPMTWTSGDSAAAQIGCTGCTQYNDRDYVLITGTVLGKVTITAATGSLRASASVDVIPPPLPSAPCCLTAAVGGFHIRLGWGTAAYERTFRVERAPNQAGPWFAVTSVDNPRRDLTNIAVGASDSVTAEAQVCYRIVAFNESGDSPASNTACVTAVAAPSNLTATPVDDSTIALVWTDNSVLEDGYEVVRAANGQWGSQVQATLSRNATSYRDTRLTQGTYQYGVRAKKMTGYNGEFFYSDLAPTGPVILALAPPTMTGIRVWATGSHAAYVDWSAQGIAAGFRVARSADSGSSWVTVATQVGSTFVDTNLSQ